MATNKIRLVQGDTAPQLQLSLTDQRTRRALDLSTPGTTARLLFREVGADGLKDTMPCFPIAGYVDPETGDVDYRPPYDEAGRGGRLAMDWSATALDTAGEFEGEVEVVFPDGRIQTAFAILRFQIREQF